MTHRKMIRVPAAVGPHDMRHIEGWKANEMVVLMSTMKTPEQRAIEQHLSKPRPHSHACCCMGPRDDDPVCPCRMEWVEKVDGIYYQISENRSAAEIGLVAEKLIVLTQEEREAKAKENILKTLSPLRLP